MYWKIINETMKEFDNGKTELEPKKRGQKPSQVVPHHNMIHQDHQNPSYNKYKWTCRDRYN